MDTKEHEENKKMHFSLLVRQKPKISKDSANVQQ